MGFVMSIQAHLMTTRRLHERHSVDLYGAAVFGSGSTSVKVIDLSYGGARISLPLPYAAYGGPVQSLRIDGVIRASVDVKWSSGNVAGLAFRQPDQHLKALFAAFVDMGLEKP